MSKAKNLGGNGQATRVAFYTRISTDEDHQKYSLGAQTERLEAFCKAQYGDDWKLHKLYRDTESGTHMNRPGLEEMLFDAGARAFDTLLVFRVDRLSRKVRELALMVDELTKNGVALKSITEPFDTANAAGKMMLQMLGVFAEFEHATIVERTKVGMEKKAKGGKFVGGNVPYGFLLDPEKGLVINEEEALIVRKMFQMYTFGKEGSSAICKQLNEAGNRNRNGRKWNRRVVLHMLRNPVYVGKIRWREVQYEGHHDPVVSEILFEKAQEVLQARHEESKGRQFHNGDERLLTGIIKCAKCKSHMFGASGTKKGVRVPYYVCSKRFNDHDCEQDYVRAELLETAIIEDVKNMFRDEQFMARIWEEANKRLGAEKPDLEKEIARIEGQMAKTQGAIDRYFEAFEAGTLKAELCNEKVRNLRTRMEELEGEKRGLEARRERLELPAIDRDMLASIVDNFEKVMAEGPNPKKKHLLHRLVKKVRIHSRQTIEVWYGLPNSQRFADCNIWLPECNSMRTRPGRVEPEVYFRIVHAAQDGHDGAPVVAPRDQVIEIALGPKGVAFDNGNIRGLTRRVSADTVNSAARPPRGKPKVSTDTRIPRGVELLRKAIKWQAQLESGQIAKQAEIARREGLSRARVTQIMGLLRLAPEIQQHLLATPRIIGGSMITARSLRPITHVVDTEAQIDAFHAILRSRGVSDEIIRFESTANNRG